MRIRVGDARLDEVEKLEPVLEYDSMYEPSKKRRVYEYAGEIHVFEHVDNDEWAWIRTIYSSTEDANIMRALIKKVKDMEEVLIGSYEEWSYLEDPYFGE